MFKKIVDLIEKIEKSHTNFYLWAVSFLSIIIVRVLMENWLSGMVNRTGDYFFHHFSYTLVFFLLSYLVFLGLLIKNINIKIKEASNVMLWGYLIIIFPPLFDFILLSDGPYLSFYGIYGLAEMPYRFFSFFGDKPDFGVTYGVRIEIAFTVVALLIYGYLKTGKMLKAFFLSLQAYIILFFLATFPSWFTIFVKGFSEGFGKVGDTDIVQLFFVPVRLFSRNTGNYLNALSIKLSIIYAFLIFLSVCLGLWFLYRKQFVAFLRNSRPVQIIYHLGLFGVGAGLSFFFAEITWEFDIFNLFSFLLIAISIVCAWLASVVVNDIYDIKIDALTNKTRPLTVGVFKESDYIAIGVVLFFVSILFSAMVNPKIAFILIAYQSLAFLYSAWPFRLKRFLGIASLVSSLASLLILMAGFILTSSMEDISQMPARIVWLIGIALIFCLPIKDLKDIEGDRKDEVMTVPVVFGEFWGKMVIGGGVFISYVLSVLVLNEKKLLIWAIILGGISFWILIFSGKNKKITNRNVIWWILGFLVIYVFVLLKLVFVLK